jgi:hypothetical protein
MSIKTENTGNSGTNEGLSTWHSNRESGGGGFGCGVARN